MKNVEDIYPLSPMQEIMLLHAHTAGQGDVLFNQFCYRIQGVLDLQAFREAWQHLVERHAALRTCFVWEGLKKPLQVVRQKIEVPFEYLDWRDRPAEDLGQAEGELRQADRAEAFDVTRAPLMRVTLVHLAPDEYFLVWSSHHLILDRWCLGVLYDDLFRAYRAFAVGRAPDLPPAYPFRDYINWLKHQDAAESEAYWRSQFSEVDTARMPTIVSPYQEVDEGSERLQVRHWPLGRELTASLHKLAYTIGVTPSMVMQGALALLMHRVQHPRHVVFGSTVSGRPAELSGVESIVGSLINNLPVVVPITPDMRLSDWLVQLMATQVQRARHEHVAVSDIQDWCGLPAGERLFDTLFVWLAAAEIQAPQGLTFDALPGRATTAHPVTISVSEDGGDLVLQLLVRAGYRIVSDVGDPLAELAALLKAFVEGGSDSLLREFGATDSPVLASSRSAAAAAAADLSRITRRYLQPEVEPVASVAGREVLTGDLLSETLHSVWCDVLRREDVGQDENFFEVGGDSLLATQLHARVEIVTRNAVPLIALFQKPTINGMAALLAGQNWPLKPDVVIPVRARGTLPPLFCIASPDVNTLGYVLLARHLSEDRPVIVLQAPPDSDSERRLAPRELPAVAADYVRAMRDIQPEGPYHMIGMCTGAHLSLEMARQLAGAGQRAAFVGILNTWAFFTISRLYWLARVGNRIAYLYGRIRALSRLDGRSRIRVLRDIAATKLGLASDNQSVADGTGQDPGTSGVLPDQHAVERPSSPSKSDPWIEQVGWTRLGDAADIKTYVGTLTVFRLRTKPFWRVRDSALGWRRFATQTLVETLPGTDHLKLMREPGVRLLGERLAAHLEPGDALDDRETAPHDTATGKPVANLDGAVGSADGAV